jgi:CDP-paratose 2-epimerase
MTKPRSKNGLATRLLRSSAKRPGPVVITGGAGFIGTNVAHRLLSTGQPVLLFDNLSRPGVERNVRWLQKQHGTLVQLETGDIRNLNAVRSAVRDASKVFHFAAQVAVTTSLESPLEDFEINARGTLNLLEAIRARPQPVPLLFTSTNKVYGDLSDLRLRMREERYEPADPNFRRYGMSETRALAFHSPYGCSKGAACQYVLDYSRTFKLPCAVFRMSCIYGPHQFGSEDQGWIAHFLIRALQGRLITIYGDGRQVRDILYVDDLVDAFLAALNHMEAVAGHAFNIGGGPGNSISLLELLQLISELNGRTPETDFEPWRPADQQYYVSDIRRFCDQTGWAPKVSMREGIQNLHQWLTHSDDSPLRDPTQVRTPTDDEPFSSRPRSRARTNGFPVGSQKWRGISDLEPEHA